MVQPDKIIRSHRRSMAIVVTDTGELVIRAPMRLSYDKIHSFILEKEKWIISKQKEIQNKNQINTDIITYKTILFLGTKYTVTYMKGLKKIELTDNLLLVPEEFKGNVIKLKQWFTKHSKKILC